MPALHRRVPDRSARRPGHARLEPLSLVLDAGAVARSRSRTGSRSARSSTAATSARRSVRGTAESRSGTPTTPSRPGGAAVSLVEWLEADGDELVERYDRLYVPRKDPRWLRRNALIAAGNVGGPAERDAVARYAEDEDDAPARARRVGARAHRPPERRVKLIRILSYVRLALVPLALAKVALDRDDFPSSRYELAAWLVVAAQALVALALLGLAYRWRSRHRYLATLNVIADAAVVTALMFVFAWEPGQPLRSLVYPRRARSRAVLPARRRVAGRRAHASGLRRARALAGGRVRCARAVRRAHPPRARRGRARRRRRAARGHGAESGPSRRASGPPRRSGCATSSGGGSTCSRRRAVRRARSALRSTWTQRSPPSSRSCAACSHSTVRRSSSWSRRAAASWRPRVSARTTSSRPGARSACRNRCWSR